MDDTNRGVLDEEDLIKLKKTLELLPDDDIADMSPIGVDAGTVTDKLPKVACQECELIGPYKSEDLEFDGVTFQVMRMTECGHGLVYGTMDAKVKERLSQARSLQKRYLTLAKAGDQAGAQRTFRKLNAAIETVKIRQRLAWSRNKHRTDLKAIPDLNDAI